MLRELLPSAREWDADPEGIYDHVLFPVLSDRPYVFANMVSSIDGKAQVNGRATGLGSPLDQALMRHLRARADLILEGAGTVRSDRVFSQLSSPLIGQRLARGQQAEPRWGVVSRSGNVPLDGPLFTAPSIPTVVLSPDTDLAHRIAASGGHCELVSIPAEGDLRAAFATLRQKYGIRWLLAEGGPHLLHSLTRQRLLDELFLTFAPRVVAGDVLTTIEGEPFDLDHAHVEIVSLYERRSELFFRYRIRYTGS
ncbi:MAG: dihydrofolate reductase family protein [Chloroflexi bacterium]|nr:dihydrofolate reductase family protein [Chloroflexota bacterium]